MTSFIEYTLLIMSINSKRSERAQFDIGLFHTNYVLFSKLRMNRCLSYMIQLFCVLYLQQIRRWPNIKILLFQRVVFSGQGPI